MSIDGPDDAKLSVEPEVSCPRANNSGSYVVLVSGEALLLVGSASQLTLILRALQVDAAQCGPLHSSFMKAVTFDKHFDTIFPPMNSIH